MYRIHFLLAPNGTVLTGKSCVGSPFFSLENLQCELNKHVPMTTRTWILRIEDLKCEVY